MAGSDASPSKSAMLRCAIGLFACFWLWMGWIFIPGALDVGRLRVDLILPLQTAIGYKLVHLAPLLGLFFLGWEALEIKAAWKTFAIFLLWILPLHALLALLSTVFLFTPLSGLVYPPSNARGYAEYGDALIRFFLWPLFAQVLLIPVTVAALAALGLLLRQRGRVAKLPAISAFNMALAAALVFLVPVGFAGSARSNVNSRDSDGMTSLMWAAKTRNDRAVGNVIRAGADVNVRDRQTVWDEKTKSLVAKGRTALEFAVESGSRESVRLILNAGADQDARDRSLLAAAYPKNAPAVSLLLIAGSNVSTRDRAGRTPLILAAMRPPTSEQYWRSDEARRQVQQSAAEQEIAHRQMRMQQSDAALQIARRQMLMQQIAAGRQRRMQRSAAELQIAEALLRAGADVNAQDYEGRTALMDAALSNNEQLVTIFTQAGADVHLKDIHGQSAFTMIRGQGPVSDHFASLLGASEPQEQAAVLGQKMIGAVGSGASDEKIISMLERHADSNARVSGTDTSPLMVAADRGNLAVMNALLHAGADVKATDFRGETALVHALKAQPLNEAIVQTLIDSGSDVNAKSGKTFAQPEPTPLMVAADRGDVGIMSILLKAGADLKARDFYGNTALHYSVNSRSQNVEVVEALIVKGCDVNAPARSGETPLMAAASRGNLAVMDALLHAGADVKATDLSGQTALLYALRAQPPNEAIVRTLIDSGSDVNGESRRRVFDETPLMIAAERGDAGIMSILLEAGADLKAQDRYGRTALHVYVGSRSQNVEVLEALIVKGSDVNAPTRSGETPLMIAASRHHPEIVRALIKAGANVNAKNDMGSTAMQHAGGDPETVAAFKQGSHTR